MSKIAVLLAFVLMLALPDLSYAGPSDFMSLEELEELLSSTPSKSIPAYFESVPYGSTMSRYRINIRGVLRMPGLKVIMFTLDPRGGQRNTIVAGMSGSPVYINGKLLGAVAYGFNPFNYNDLAWGGISPISLMYREAVSKEESVMASGFLYEGKNFEPIAVGNENISEAFIEKLAVQGNYSRAEIEFLRHQKFVIRSSRPSALVGRSPSKPVLKAGMPIVVDLLEWTDETGDVSTISSMGTITYVGKDGRVFAFGHPFLNAKKVVYGFRTSEVTGTIFSQSKSYKMGGSVSDVLGTISYDGSYGIYGSTSVENLKKLHTLRLNFKSRGAPTHAFNVKLADSVFTPILANVALKMIGENYGAPIDEEPSVTEFSASVTVNGLPPVNWKELFSSVTYNFGPQTIYLSSYNAASQHFVGGIYSVLLRSRYGFSITDVSITADFIPGVRRSYKYGAAKFPNKIVWGEDPVLELLLVDENNSAPLAKRIKISVDWSKVEKPVYARDTPDTKKESEKIVGGGLVINSPARYYSTLSESEKQVMSPEYFLGPEDFLRLFSLRLSASIQKVFITMMVKSRSGLFDDQLSKAEDIMPANMQDSPGWHVIEGGLKKRKITVKDEGFVRFSADLPPLPSGYTIDQNLSETFLFEIVTN